MEHEHTEKEAIRKFSDGSVHIEGRCSECHWFLRWVPYKESYTVKKLLEVAYVK